MVLVVRASSLLEVLLSRNRERRIGSEVMLVSYVRITYLVVCVSNDLESLLNFIKRLIASGK